LIILQNQIIGMLNLLKEYIDLVYEKRKMIQNIYLKELLEEMKVIIEYGIVEIINLIC